MAGKAVSYWKLPLVALVIACGYHGFFYEPCLQATRDSIRTASELGDAWWNWFVYLLDTAHRTIRLFALQVDRGCAPPTSLIGDSAEPVDQMLWSLQLARFGAMAITTYAALSLILPRVLQWMRILGQAVLWRRRAVILGYGPLGQAFALELRSPGRRRLVTAVHRGVTDALSEAARRQGVLLVEGDPSDPAVHDRVWLGWSAKVLSATGKDMETLDTAVAATAVAGGARVRAILSDPDLASDLTETTARGFLGSSAVEPWSLALEAARLLIAQARFDRDAIDLGQRRVHLVIVGCGSQGEAVAIETLLTAWRTELKPPAITILDKKVGAVEARFRRRASALFLGDGEDGALPPAARPVLRFLDFDAEIADYGSAAVAGLFSGVDRPTAWIFASADDSLNLRAASSLHAAMLKRRLHAAPIHIRIWSGHQGDTPVLSGRPVTLAQAFGALETTLAATPACDDDPDAIARELHDAYRAAGEEMDRKGKPIGFFWEPWEALPETLKNANRSLHRHAVMKIEDLGGQWRRDARKVPVVDATLRTIYSDVEEAIDYDRVTEGQLDPVWWREDDYGPEDPVTGESARAQRLKDVAIVEHNRWTIDRALDGWCATPVRDASQRDNERRLHHNMHDWSTLDAVTRRWDAVLLRALVKGEVGRVGKTAWKARAAPLVLSLRTPAVNGNIDKPRFLLDIASMADGTLTELRIVIVGEPAAARRTDLVVRSEALMRSLLKRRGVTNCLCRVRFDFHAPPGEGALAIANAMGVVASHWHAGRYQHDFAPELGIEVSALWNWGPSDGPRIGFVGHRELARVGGEEGLVEHLETVFARLIAAGNVGLVTGHAPGADRVAQRAWDRIGASKPLLIFPYAVGPDGEPTHFLTNKPGTDDERIDIKAARKLGIPRLARRRRGLDPHRAQALELLEASAVLVAVTDGKGPSGPGSAGDTIDEARKRRMRVIEVKRAGDGAWTDDFVQTPAAMA